MPWPAWPGGVGLRGPRGREGQKEPGGGYSEFRGSGLWNTRNFLIEWSGGECAATWCLGGTTLCLHLLWNPCLKELPNPTLCQEACAIPCAALNGAETCNFSGSLVRLPQPPGPRTACRGLIMSWWVDRPGVNTTSFPGPLRASTPQSPGFSQEVGSWDGCTHGLPCPHLCPSWKHSTSQFAKPLTIWPLI